MVIDKTKDNLTVKSKKKKKFIPNEDASAVGNVPLGSYSILLRADYQSVMKHSENNNKDSNPAKDNSRNITIKSPDGMVPFNRPIVVEDGDGDDVLRPRAVQMKKVNS